MANVNASNTYGLDRTLTTRMEREGLDLGPRPDFWADLDEITHRTGQQAQPNKFGLGAASNRGGGGSGSSTNRDYTSPGGSGLEPYFGTLASIGYGSSPLYSPYTPGMMVGAGNEPVAMGYRRPQTRGRGRE